METDVVVVGAGPTGLMLGHELGLAGVACVVVERLAERSRQSKAGNLQPRSVEVLDLRGLIEPLMGRGLGEKVAHGGHFAMLPMPLSYDGWPTRHPYQIGIPQVRLERLLEEQLEGREVPLVRPLDVTALEQDREGVTVTATGPDGDVQLRSRYLVACDGAHSTVRKLVGAAFPGRPGRIGAVLADVVIASNGDGDVATERRHISEHVRARPDIWAVLMPMDGGSHRFIFGGPEQQGVPRDAPVTHDEVQRALHASSGPGVRLEELLVASRFTDASRQAEQYRHGRVLLAGDAAHVHLPLGGQGMNLGLQDAFNLGWKLAADVQGWAPDGLLDSYHTERHPVGARVLQNTQAQGALNRPDEDTADLRAIFADLLRLPEVNRRLSGMVSGLDVRYEMPGGGTHPAVGGWLTDLELTGPPGGPAQGGACRVSGLMRPARGLLLELGGQAELGDAATRWAGRVDHVVVQAGESAGMKAMLVRPDGHVCWAAAAPDTPDTPDIPASPGAHPGAESLQQLDEALALWFGPPRV